ncbi:2,3-diketo-5-methylthio-1-phosphopentane phosphatase [Leptospira wolbachii serovar Codice str. CDC]|uniref:Enolase-phosphatase E1 n=1 Tax=Leptospira wolbachii serovar Codice str. CDC TaxID=1218599 RepID=R9A0A3_9LEPT|nr:acireductone synthase [Leptospira wolbachii]EOQ95552.1 2,3-diketo-5-methylthio-1-phosphopentane phosphatase [Leptospira wolbachii serovar Codice str. CDC]
MKIKHNLLDIEGTTAPIAFVHQVLFPYAKKHIGSFLKTYQFSKDRQKEIQLEFEKDITLGEKGFLNLFAKEGTTQQSNTISFSLELIPSYFEYLIEKDRKFGPLKEIQGKIWKEGYESGEIKSIVYEDVPVFLKNAKEEGIQNHVYSSGSVEAQILIYQYSELGDLRNFFTSYFDTAVGGKREKTSYENIANELKSPPNQIRFFTDIIEEAEAANAIGMDVVILNRPGNLPQKPHHFPVWDHF